MTDEAARDREAQRSIRRLLRSFRSPDSFGLVLVMIIITYVMAISLTSERWGAAIVLLAQIVTVRLSLHTSRAGVVLRRASDVLLAFAAFAAVANIATNREEGVLAVVFLGSSLLYFIAPFSILREIIFRRIIDRETMLGVLAAYLFFGMAFAFAYRFLADVQSGPFFGDAGEGGVPDDLFFSFVTLTTTGYGNLVPEENPGQSLAVLEALVGQLFLVTAVAKLVNAWQPGAKSQADTTGDGEETA